MKSKPFILVAAITLGSINAVNSADENRQPEVLAREMASVNYLIGTWNCAHRVGTFSGKYTTTYSKTLGEHWLRETWDFPAQNTAERKEAAVTAEALMGV
jgi:hypothetical protein